MKGVVEQRWNIRHGRHTATVSERGGAISRYAVNGVPVIRGVPDGEVPSAFDGAVLAPWPNRIRDGRWTFDASPQQLAITEPGTGSALHGLLAWAPWQLQGASEDAVTLSAVVLPQPGYPLSVAVSVTWSVSADGLKCLLEVRNLGERAAPFGVGTHPYFSVAGHRVDDLSLTLPAASWIETDERLLPVARRSVEDSAGKNDFRQPRSLRDVSLDTAFTGVTANPDGTSTVRLAGPDGELEIWAEESFGWWQVYTSDYFDPGSERYRREVAIEAMTCGPDAFNTGQDLIVLEPGAQWQGRWGVRPRD